MPALVCRTQRRALPDRTYDVHDRKPCLWLEPGTVSSAAIHREIGKRVWSFHAPPPPHNVQTPTDGLYKGISAQKQFWAFWTWLQVQGLQLLEMGQERWCVLSRYIVQDNELMRQDAISTWLWWFKKTLATRKQGSGRSTFRCFATQACFECACYQHTENQLGHPLEQQL